MSDQSLLTFQFDGEEESWPLNVATIPLVNEFGARLNRLTRENEEATRLLADLFVATDPGYAGTCVAERDAARAFLLANTEKDTAS